MKHLSRRTFLRGAGVSLALPLLEAMIPGARAAAAAAATSPRRMVAINIPLGFLGEKFFPTGTGTGYELSEYLKPGEALRGDFTVFSGVSHPDVDGGHSAEKSFLTAAAHPGSRSFKNSISLDQYVAKQIGDKTRFASLTLGDHSLSWTANGVPIPVEQSPAKAFAKLFLTGTPKEVAAQEQELDQGRSIMDTVLEDAKSIEGKVSAADRDKLDQFFTAVRETEQRLSKAQAWSQTPKPKVNAAQPGKLDSTDLVGTFKANFDIIRLALETDSTRVVALGGTGYGLVPTIKGVTQAYHALSHHGKNPEMMGQLALIERATIEAFWAFLGSLKQSADGGSSLLDNTQVLLGSNLGNASGHLTTNLPVILAGGGFKHGQHLAFDQKNNYPLPNLFVSMLQRMGVEAGSFASSTGTMRGLEMMGV
ncbi:uncharacterized protein DUF1552 [Roseimicrobium gellanilyticum]|uniref:Uncharacterized protein DUF1552 n=1 Tax=Roseimicrobium gellanilyticum TaxID=748857 RepID=A0A366HF35_9BACT|nr:DUF1552 domain-containing protein [Roseimicrobium gellanilyticum]RBP41192.1 uncharacterized protein DUF1552 [Roseimicrobium gellanilyticum]